MYGDIAFRADATPEMGAGHLVRCLALADECLHRRLRTFFISRTLAPHLEDLIARRGHAIMRLDESSDVVGSRELLRRLDGVDWLVYDHYGLDAFWSAALRPYARHVMAIDDLANRRHECDLILDQTPCPNPERRYAHLIPEGCQRLFGATFALLRREFAAARPSTARHPSGIRALAIAMGGFSDSRYVARILDAISRVSALHGVAIHILGNSSPVSEHAAQITQHGFLEDPAPLLRHMDIAVGAAGSSALERCCLGLPSIIVTIAQNQELLASSLQAAGCVRYLGSISEVDALQIAATLSKLHSDPAEISAMGRHGLHLVDGNGASRVADRMCAVT